MPDLAQRIEAAFMRRTGKPSPYGARAWFARTARVHPYTVSRWLSGARPLEGPPLAVLELLEADEGARASLPASGVTWDMPHCDNGVVAVHVGGADGVWVEEWCSDGHHLDDDERAALAAKVEAES